MKSVEVREDLIDALRLDLIGPGPGHPHRKRDTATGSLSLVLDRLSCSLRSPRKPEARCSFG